jgi:RNA polymerase sporulation-specific sigma factor
MSTRVEISGMDVSSVPRLNQEENLALLRRAQKGDKKARDEFLVSNVKLILSVIQRYYAKKGEADDLFQIGFIGLTKAADNFDPDLSLCFSTYAIPMIIGEIRRYLRDFSPVRVTRSMRDTAYKVIKERQRIEREQNREATLDEVASTLEIPLNKAVEAMDAISDTVSLFDPVYHDGKETTLLMDQISDTKNTDEKWIENIQMEESIKRLTPKEREILDLRYYKGKTQTEISEEIGISQAQVSRLEKNAKKYLLKAMS